MPAPRRSTRDEDVAAAALASLDAAAAKSFDDLAGDNADWWHAFWQRGTIALHSADGAADYVAENYHYFLYLMASTSRGAFPPKFNGMLWNTAGDLRPWGTQHWFANLSCYYEALFAANRLELLDPVFSMYSGMFDAAATAARQQWGSQGIFIPETVWFDGLAPLPDDIAAEMRELYLLRKPWAQRSARFLEFARTGHPHSSRWNWWGGGRWVDGQWVPTERPDGAVRSRHAHPRHDREGRVSLLAALRVHAGRRVAARPRVPDAQGRRGVLPPLPQPAEGEPTASTTSITSTATRACGRARHRRGPLGDARHLRRGHPRQRVPRHGCGAARGLARRARRTWRRCRRATIPMRCGPPITRAAPVFVRGLKPDGQGRPALRPTGTACRMWFFDLVEPRIARQALLAAANATFDARIARASARTTPVGVLSKWAIAGTTLGRADATRFMVPNQMRSLTAEREPPTSAGGRS